MSKRMIFYSEKTLDAANLISAINTPALDHIRDGMRFYVDGKHKWISDDGYIRNEFAMFGFDDSGEDKNIDAYCKRIASHYDCYMKDDELMVDYEGMLDFEEKLIYIIQAETIISAEINRRRLYS